jgi:hypothetical protein
MSSNNLWQICHKKMTPNKGVTIEVVTELRRRQFSTKQVARELDIPTERVRNWYYKNTGMTAFDLILLFQKYDFIEQIMREYKSCEDETIVKIEAGRNYS